MQIKEVIILAGGLGTRLRNVAPETPKCLASVSGRPFISYVIDHFSSQNVERFIFSLGYKAENIIEFISKHYPGIDLEFVIERQPLGTGGGIKKSCQKASGNNVFVANGDTLFKVNCKDLGAFHINKEADCTLSLKPMKNFDRFGVVEVNSSSRIEKFKEKAPYGAGLVNGGVFVLNIPRFLNESFADKFSFENDYLGKQAAFRKIYGLVQEQYFIDIGVPEDFFRAQNELFPHSHT